MQTPQAPNSRYVLPQFEERTPHGSRTQDPYSRLFRDRIIFLGTQIDEVSANDVMSQLLVLDSLKTEQITMYINSTGGHLGDATAIIDTMNYISSPVATVCLGKAYDSAALLLASGHKGLRAMLPNAKALLAQPETQGGRGQATDINLQAEEIISQRAWVEATLSSITGRSPEQVVEDIERHNYLNAQKSVEYGLVDIILTNKND